VAERIMEASCKIYKTGGTEGTDERGGWPNRSGGGIDGQSRQSKEKKNRCEEGSRSAPTAERGEQHEGRNRKDPGGALSGFKIKIHYRKICINYEPFGC